jgi:hypothetical protein
VVDSVRAHWAAVLLNLGDGIAKIFKFIWT